MGRPTRQRHQPKTHTHTNAHTHKHAPNKPAQKKRASAIERTTARSSERPATAGCDGWVRRRLVGDCCFCWFCFFRAFVGASCRLLVCWFGGLFVPERWLRRLSPAPNDSSAPLRPEKNHRKNTNSNRPASMLLTRGNESKRKQRARTRAHESTREPPASINAREKRRHRKLCGLALTRNTKRVSRAMTCASVGRPLGARPRTRRLCPLERE